MIDERIEELMWQKIDGEISPDDHTTLEAYLRDHSEAGEHYRELTGIAEALGGGHTVEVPPSLRPRIEAAIDWSRYAPRPAQTATGWLQRLFPAEGWDLRVVPVAVAAFVLGIIAYQLAGTGAGPREVFDKSRFFGTIGTQPDAKMSPLRIDLDAVQGTIEFNVVGDVTVAQIALTSEREIEMQMHYEGESLEFGALGEAQSLLEGVTLSDHALTVSNVGANKYYFVFRSDSRSEPVRVRLLDESGLLVEREWIPDRTSTR